MVSSGDKEWKKKLGFPINFDSGQSSDDDFDSQDVVMRHPRRSSRYLLQESGDGSEADLLGTTPPRARIRDKEKRRNLMESGTCYQRSSISEKETVPVFQPTPPERLKKRASLKLVRSKERDWKQEFGQREPKADSLPSPGPVPAVPTLVESCNRFMSLTSRLKSRPAEELVLERPDEELPPSRVNFHNTFSMLINMGNMEKGCRRTISREEKVWQNELKDLIWLEIQAKIAGRSLAQQDAFLCAQRNVIPNIVQRIMEYKFVSTRPCCRPSGKLQTTLECSNEDLSLDSTDGTQGTDMDSDEYETGCLNIECTACSEAIGAAMREVGALLDAFDAATALYPSSLAAAHDHPALAQRALADRLRAMCLWYNTALHLRLKILSVRRMLHTVRMRNRRRNMQHKTSVDSTSSKSSDTPRPCQVRFNVSCNASDSNNSSNSDTSAQSDNTDDKKDSGIEDHAPHDISKIIKTAESQGCDEEQKFGAKDIVDGPNYVGDGEKIGGEEQSTDDKRGYGPGDESLDKEKSVDSGYSRSEYTASTSSGSVTPEVVLDACADGAPAERHCAGALRLGALHDLTQLRLLARTQVSAYRDYHREILKTAGVRRCMMFMNKICSTLLQKVYLTLQEPTDDTSTDEELEVEHRDGDQSNKEMGQSVKNIHELRRFGCWSPENIAMRLPSYRNHFLLLNCICMEALHDYLSLRIDMRPDQPSCLTIKQLIHELREGLDIAAETRASFARNACAALRGWRLRPRTRADLMQILHTYDATVETATQQYLSYLSTMSATEALSRGALSAECAFSARLAARAPSAKGLVPPAFAQIACNQLDRLLKEFEDKFENLSEVKEHTIINDPRYIIYLVCREAQTIYSSSREAALQAAQWARMLACRLSDQYNKNKAKIFDSLMALCNCLAEQTKEILARSNPLAAPHAPHAPHAPAPSPVPPEARESLGARVRELLLQMFKLGFEMHTEMHKFVHGPYKFERELKSRRLRPASLQPLAPPPVQRRRRPETILIHQSINPMMHKELHGFVNDAAAQRAAAASRSAAPAHAPAHASPRRVRLLRCDSLGEEVDGSVLDDAGFRDGPQKNSLELLLTGDTNRTEQTERTEPEVEQSKAEETEWAKRSARAIVELAKSWMGFVVERCDRGRGLRPRWASQGLEFLMLACDPYNTKHLTDEEFEALKQQMDGCISHVIGSRPAPRSDPAYPCSMSPTPHRHRLRLHSPVPNPNSMSKDSTSSPSSEQDTPPVYSSQDSMDHSKRVAEAVHELDEQRDASLRAAGSVGRVLGAAVHSYEPKLRQLTFKWQRGLKIGAGTFGKVYTVVNTENGQVLAMKELSIGAGDRRALQRAANELRVLEGVAHPHLVRYYGCELHREEMLLFMELCVEGSLEALIATSGALAEHAARRYTQQLLAAVRELHARAIAHRDIKSGNIFLTNEGNCLKLGDFGCAVKIRANTTAPGELQGFVGTQAYMAPEVFMKSSGHGRAADIWSLGCVVTEMATGKRPFSEYDSNYQIMFVVGMGGRPHIPSSLSAEGREFCVSCLTHDPALRPTADALSLHHFLLVKADDDCNCKPANPLRR
ncbi:uncharacterized protein LOC119837484 isoform X2 [Zerene cesonia]|uniref:uncharacterized protein LOC119837484 isoform X2 n=1 Tax=Zerene cesonia TaxID=33412 RepID=UPI0018E56175|nr:uncharacterized protein LOC119837484 isoform X2 [Zerene cesonia]